MPKTGPVRRSHKQAGGNKFGSPGGRPGASRVVDVTDELLGQAFAVIGAPPGPRRGGGPSEPGKPENRNGEQGR